MFLVDTNVISAGTPTRASPHEQLLKWMEANSHHLFLSVITIAEIEEGVAKLRRQTSIEKAERIAEWLQTVLHLYADRILPLDLGAARRLGSLSDRARASGVHPGLADLAIAATAASRDLLILTRNIRHFEGLGVPCLDPFQHLPP